MFDSSYVFVLLSIRCKNSIKIKLLNLPGILIVVSRVNWDDGLGRDATFADRAYHSVARLVHPHVNAGPAVQMTALANYWLFSSVQTNVTLEHRWL